MTIDKRDLDCGYKFENMNVEVRNVMSPVDIIGGRLKHFSSEWENITSDVFILNSVKHYKIEFENEGPWQSKVPKEINFTPLE